ncbi:MAG: PorT family protein [Cyclobacteriaceae bacterium]|nr:PorT family protein [Cyclobacteriaceae bacterium]
MKRVLLLSFLASSFFLSSAQKFTVGVKGGVQGYTMRYQQKDIRDVFHNRFKGGFLGGLVIGFPLPADFSFIAESQLSVKGRKVRFNQSTLDPSYAWVNNSTYYFIENSLLLRKEFPVSFYDFHSSWYFNVGPNISYWMGGNGVLTTTTSTTGLNYKMVFTDSVYYDPRSINFNEMQVVDANRWLFGLDFGVGFMTHVLGNQRFFSEVRFTYGHTYLGQSYSANLYVLGFDDNLRNAYRSLNVTLGYAISLDLRDQRKGKSTLDKQKRRAP